MTLAYPECFSEFLKKFDMIDSPGLIFVRDKTSPKITPYERLALETAERYKADAVYFRKFPNGERPSIPQIYIYDYTTIEKESQAADREIAEIHRLLWNSTQVPLFFVFRRESVQIFNCTRPPKYDELNNVPRLTTLETI